MKEEAIGVACTTNLHEKHARTGLAVFARCEENAANIHIPVGPYHSYFVCGALHIYLSFLPLDPLYFAHSAGCELHTFVGWDVGRGEGGGILFPFLSFLSLLIHL